MKFIFQKGYYPFWTNLDKSHICRGKQTAGDYDTVPLAKLEKQGIPIIERFNEAFLFNGKTQSILLHEADIVKPDAIIFLTGDHYASMESASVYDGGDNYPHIELDSDRKVSDCTKLMADITEDLNITNKDGKIIPALWTLHPQRLQFLSVKEEDKEYKQNWFGILSKIEKFINRTVSL